MDLDLSSLNHTVVKPNFSGAGGPKTGKTSNNKGKENTSTTRTPEPDAEEISSGAANPRLEDGSASPEPQAQQPRLGSESLAEREQEQDDADLNALSNVQVLDLHTRNPIISYQDHVYSCSWVDMIGTNMFFTQPGISEDYGVQPLLSTDEFDLLGTSTIKLVGHRAYMKKSSKKRARPEDDGEDYTNNAERAELPQQDPEGRSLGTLTRSNPKKNAQIKRQAAFLEKLMEIKDKRGHQDSVRAYVDEKIASHEQSKLSETQRTEIDELNRRVVRGDGDALERLEKIYSQLDDDHRDDGDGDVDDNAMEPQAEPEPGDGPGGLEGPENMQIT